MSAIGIRLHLSVRLGDPCLALGARAGCGMLACARHAHGPDSLLGLLVRHSRRNQLLHDLRCGGPEPHPLSRLRHREGLGAERPGASDDRVEAGGVKVPDRERWR